MRRVMIPLMAWFCLAHGDCEDGHVEPHVLDEPCPVAVDSAESVTERARATESKTAWRVADGGDLYVSGEDVDVIVEAGGRVDLSGPGGRAWVKAGGSVVAWSEGSAVWFEEGAEVFGSNDKVVWMRCLALTE